MIDARSSSEPHRDRAWPDDRFAQKPTSRRQGIHETHPTRPPTLRNTATSLPHILHQGNRSGSAPRMLYRKKGFDGALDLRTVEYFDVPNHIIHQIKDDHSAIDVQGVAPVRAFVGPRTRRSRPCVEGTAEGICASTSARDFQGTNLSGQVWLAA